MRFPSFLFVLLGCLCATTSAGGNPVLDLLKYKTFREPGMAMEPTIGPGDVVYVDLTYFGTNQPRVGDVVLYKVKSLKNGPTAKRIVALGAGSIEIKDGTLIIDGRVIDEPYLKRGGAVTPYSRNWGPMKLPAGCIFLLGDYRDHSQDSRVDGCSSAADLVGLVKRVVSSTGQTREVK